MGWNAFRSVAMSPQNVVLEALERRAHFSSAVQDPDFGTGGVAYTAAFDAMDTVMYPDGRILKLVHDASGWDSERIELVRFTAAGIRDVTFAPDGRVVTTFADRSDISLHYAKRAAIQADGKIVVGSIPRLAWADTSSTLAIIQTRTATR